jgi:hypothetical protein
VSSAARETAHESTDQPHDRTRESAQVASGG